MTRRSFERPTRRSFVATLLGCLTWTGCATLVPPVTFAPPADAPSSSDRPLRVVPVEGRPRGLLLRFESNRRPTPGSTLQLLRHLEGKEPQIVKTVTLSERFLERLVDGGLEFLDRSLSTDSTVHYQLQLQPPDTNQNADEEPIASEVLTLHWPESPPTPRKVDSRADTPLAVELHWRPVDRHALIFRRDLLADGDEMQRFARVDRGNRGIWVDRDVEPGGVYAYRVAFAVEVDDFLRYGSPSETLYVSVPEEGR